jgi:Class III cytochrome C family
MSRLVMLAAAAALLLAFAAPVFADPPAVIILKKPEVFGWLSRAPVRFTHADHMKLDGVSCLTCHHDFKNGKNTLDPGRLIPGDPSTQCASCHARPVALEQGFHQMCITCHDAEKKKGRVTGPRSCGECHAWQK